MTTTNHKQQRQFRLAVLQHCAAEGPGHIATWACARGHQLDLFRTDLNQRPAWRQYDGAILLGGPWSVNTVASTPWMQPLVRELKQHCGRLRLFGICLGAQLLAQALGATIRTLDQAETGWCEVTLASSNTTLPVLHWHDEGFDLPPGARRHIHGTSWHNQGFVWPVLKAQQNDKVPKPIVGLQFHPEWQREQLAHFIEHDATSPFTADDLQHAHRFEHLHRWLEQQLNVWLDS